MFDPALTIFFLMLTGVTALEIGVFDLSGGTDPDDGEGEPTSDRSDELLFPDAPAFLAEDYSNIVYGSNGDDTAVAGADDENVAYLLGGGDDTLVATGGDDFADGGAGDDTLTTLDGDDILSGGAGNDTLRGGSGDDEIWGGDGDDQIYGHGHNDTIFGGAGDDVIEGGDGDDEIHGGDGNDTISGDLIDSPAQLSRGLDVIDGGAGDDNIFLGDGDEATGGTGADSFQVFEIESPDAPAANITDFNASEDSLHVHYYAQTDPDSGDPVDPGLTVAYDADTDVTSVSIFGGEIATLSGDAGITAADVTLTEMV